MRAGTADTSATVASAARSSNENLTHEVMLERMRTICTGFHEIDAVLKKAYKPPRSGTGQADPSTQFRSLIGELLTVAAFCHGTGFWVMDTLLLFVTHYTIYRIVREIVVL